MFFILFLHITHLCQSFSDCLEVRQDDGNLKHLFATEANTRGTYLWTVIHRLKHFKSLVQYDLSKFTNRSLITDNLTVQKPKAIIGRFWKAKRLALQLIKTTRATCPNQLVQSCWYFHQSEAKPRPIIVTGFVRVFPRLAPVACFPRLVPIAFKGLVREPVWLGSPKRLPARY